VRYDKSETQGRWPSILSALGVDDKTLSKRNVPCPFCGGKDRFRFTDHEGAGVWVCNQCVGGNGMQFVEKWENCDFVEAVKKVREVLPQAHVAPAVKEHDPRAKLNRLWSAASPLVHGDPAAEYLTGRGLWVPLTTALRTHPACPYYEDGKVVGEYPAMLALVRDIKGQPKTLHVTYVTGGKKAPVRTPRKVLSKTGEGPSVRLFDPEDGFLAVTEGVETAIAVNKRADVPVWSLLSAGAMQQFQPPPGLTDLWVFGDNDASFTGQQAAYNLAHRITRDTDIKVRVCIPKKEDTDWADVMR
jgi:putative DNA primase/helicase